METIDCKAVSMTEFEVRRKAKEFVTLYLAEGSEAAGKYGLANILDPEKATEEDLMFWQAEIAKEFERKGFKLVKDEDGKVEAEEGPACA
jgi:hypothetical protein